MSISKIISETALPQSVIFGMLYHSVHNLIFDTIVGSSTNTSKRVGIGLNLVVMNFIEGFVYTAELW